MARKVNFILQGKGGVGKSFVASLLAQHYGAGVRNDIVCVDTDPVNATFSGYEAFNVRRVELLVDGKVDTGSFDPLMESILTEDAHFVIDNGASCFVPLTQYLFESNALDLILSTGRDVVLHSVITGGYGLLDTVAGFDLLAQRMPAESQMVVWLNEFFGPIKSDGKTFEQMKVYETHRDRITAIFSVPEHTPATFGRDLKMLLDRRMTFAEAKASNEFGLITKQRIAMMERQFLDQIKLVG
ncbi:MAG: conjugal transfer protein TraL [Anaeromyxobacteraceae bacterium]